jgi:hypothetical protein
MYKLTYQSTKPYKLYIFEDHFVFQIYHLNYTYWLPSCSLHFCNVSYKYYCSVRLYPQLFVGRLMSHIYYMCWFAYSGVQYVLTIRVTRRGCVIRDWNRSPFASTWNHPPGLVRSVLPIFLAVCVFCYACLCLVSLINVASVSGLSIVMLVFVLCL